MNFHFKAIHRTLGAMTESAKEALFMRLMMPWVGVSVCLSLFIGLCLCVCVWALPANAAPVPASTPELRMIIPRGMQRGTNQLLKFTGVRLNEAEEVFFYDDGIKVLSIKGVDQKTVEVNVEVAENCRLGEHVAQLRTKHGISDFRSVFVGAMSEIKEVEPNNDFETIQRIELNRTVNGVLLNEDVDRFALDLKMGQRLSVEVEAVRLGTFVDPVIELFGPDGASLARSDDTALAGLDGFFTIRTPTAGVYSIAVSDSAYQGNPSSHYRLHVGDFPRPAGVIPAGGPPQTDVKLAPADNATFQKRDAHGGVHVDQIETKTPATERFRDGIFLSDANGVTPSPVAFRLTELKNISPPVDGKYGRFQDALPIDVPCAIDARLNSAVHHFRFTAKKGQAWDIEALAKRIGSNLDPVIHVFNLKRKVIVGNDDNQTRPDATIRFKAPADGDYVFRIRDYLNRTEENFPYRIEFKLAEPSVELTIKRNDRFSQRRQAMAIPQGGRLAAIVSVKKNTFNEALELGHGPLPDGVTMMSMPMRKGAAEMPVVFDADEDAELSGSLVDITASQHVAATEDSAATTKPLKHRFEIPALFSLGQPNNACYHKCPVDRLAVGVIERLPFSIDVVPMRAPIVRGGSAKVKIKITRDEGFKQVIRLQFPFRPPGIGTTYQVQVKPDQTEAVYPINANNGAQLGQWPFYVIANSNVKGTAWTSSQLTTMTIAEPFVKCESDRVVGQRGQSLSVNVNIEQLIEFDGMATAQVRGLPPHTTINGPLEFDKETKSLTFEMKTTDKTPFGNHKGLFVEVAIPSGGEMSIGRAGNIHLQVQKPPKQKQLAGKTVATAAQGKK